MKIQIVDLAPDLPPEVSAYIAARLLVRNGRRIDYVINREPENDALFQAGIEDWDTADLGLHAAVSGPPHKGEDVQWLIMGHGRKVSEVAEVLLTFADMMQDSSRFGYLTVVWLCEPKQMNLLEKRLDLLDQASGVTLSITKAYATEDTYEFEPSIGVNFRVNKEQLPRSLSIILEDLQDLDRTFRDM